MREPIKTGIIGGIIGLVMSMTVNYFFVPIPLTEMGNALGNGMSGLVSGFLSGCLGLSLYLRGARNSVEDA